MGCLGVEPSAITSYMELNHIPLHPRLYGRRPMHYSFNFCSHGSLQDGSVMGKCDPSLIFYAQVTVAQFLVPAKLY